MGERAPLPLVPHRSPASELGGENSQPNPGDDNDDVTSAGDAAMTETAVETLTQWFSCFARGDLEAARELVAPNCVFHVFADDATEIHGFDEFIAWYGRRRALLGESFDYRVEELLAGNRHAAALLTLGRTAEGRLIEWRQVAVYRIEGGVITEVRAYEEPPSAANARCTSAIE